MVPLPQKRVTFSAWSIISTSLAISLSPGRTLGRSVTSADSMDFSGAGLSAMSPGRVTTLTPPWPMAFWMAVWSSRGICSGLEIISQ